MMSRGKLVKQIVTWLICVAMVLVSMNFSVAVNEVKAAAKTNYLTFTADGEKSSVTFKYKLGTAMYSTDKGTTWVDCPSGTKITLNANQSVCLKGTNVTTDSKNHFSMTGKIKASGSVTSLTDGKGSDPNVTLTERCYYYMFSECKALTQAPKLPATTLAGECYSYMFHYCTRLIQAPELPATELAKKCYERMFNSCTSLTQAPQLPATKLAYGCYSGMFVHCTSLTQAPELPATKLAVECYSYMFYLCKNLTQAPELPVTELAENCYEYMFWQCTSLTQAPELPATKLAKGCYVCMFRECTSLTQAPELPATELAENCYKSMFMDCISLIQAPELPATTLKDFCYDGMFMNCTSLSQAPELPVMTLADHCYQSMFEGCKSLTQAPKLPATTMKEYCYAGMFEGCTSITEAPELPAKTLKSGCYKAMFSGCTSLVEPPKLPATELAGYCYDEMFYNTNIVIKTESDSKYHEEWKIPATESAYNWNRTMFPDLTPELNTVYYVYGHNVVSEVKEGLEGQCKVKETCTTEGEYYRYCTGCDKLSTNTFKVPATGHTEVVDPAVPATTTSTGLTEGSHCSDCGIVFVEQQVIPKLSPTVTPTAVPTKAPTSSPAVTPTIKPTATPTKAPVATAVPTKAPTSSPAVTPTVTPTAKPTVAPTKTPEKNSGTESFIERLYTVALSRDFDEGGKNYWTNEIKVNGQTGADIARQFLYSEEFLGKNMSQDDFLTVLYRTFFDREPDAGGMKFWKDQMSAGQTKEWVIAGFINSEEWANICLSFGIRSGSSVAPTITIVPNENVIGFATRLYTTCLKREFDPEGLDFWAKELANLRRTGSEAAKGFFFSDEINKSGISDSEFLTRLYKTLMNREPEKEGFDYWLGQMKSGAMSRESVFDGFAASEEWVGICADYGILR